VFGNLLNETETKEKSKFEQINLFTNYEKVDIERKKENEKLQNEKKIQKTIIEIKNKYGKNAILKGINLEEGATTIERNNQIGGHKE
jgi:DNA polymerase V